MKTREFIINTQNLEFNYDFTMASNILQEFIVEDLEIPQECLKSFDIDDEVLKIKLSPGRKYFNDDWYINLQRVS